MEDKDTKDQESRQPVSAAMTDWFLQQFARMADNPKVAAEVGITLHVGGLVVTGTMVGGSKYFEGVAQQLANATSDRPDLPSAFAQIADYKSIYDDYQGEDLERSMPPPQFIHLRNARLLLAGQGLTLTMPWWRGRISEVAGFSFGELKET